MLNLTDLQFELKQRQNFFHFHKLGINIWAVQYIMLGSKNVNIVLNRIFVFFLNYYHILNFLEFLTHQVSCLDSEQMVPTPGANCLTTYWYESVQEARLENTYKKTLDLWNILVRCFKSTIKSIPCRPLTYIICQLYLNKKEKYPDNQQSLECLSFSSNL